MADLTAVTTNFFATASETYAGNLSATIGAGDPTVTATNLSAYADGDVVVLTIEPGTANEATFTGTKSGSTISNVKWTEGNLGVGHAGGVTIVDYDSASHFSMTTKGIKKFANQDGTLKATSIQSALGLGSDPLNGWNVLGYTPATVTYKGNRSYECVFNGQNLTTTLSAGMRFRTGRTVAAPTQSTSLNGTTQYWSKAAPAGMTFTDDFTVSAWIKVSSYSLGVITARISGTSGWQFYLSGVGQLVIQGLSAGTGDAVTTHQSVPLNKWVHVAATLDMSGAVSTTYIDGVSVPHSYNNNAATAVTQAGDLYVGRNDGGNYFPGKIAQVAIFSSILSAATIQSYYSQGIPNGATSLVSAYAFDGNGTDINTTNANNLTANGGAVATNADSFCGGQADGTISSTLDYGILQKVSFTGGNTTTIVQVAEGCTIPTTGGVTSVAYSSQKAPYGFPAEKEKWRLKALHKVQASATASTTYANVGSLQLNVPIGSFEIGYHAQIQQNPTSAVTASPFATLSTSPTASVDDELTAVGNITGSGVNIAAGALTVFRSKGITNTTAATQYLNLKTAAASGAVYLRGDESTNVIFAENSYL